MADDAKTSSDAIELATELTIAWLSNPNTRASAEDVPAFLKSMHGAVSDLAASTSGEAAQPDGTAAEIEHAPAVSVRKSLASKDHIISMIDGKPYKMLRRHLSTHGLTPAEYRARYGLKSDYPMVAPAYSEHRRRVAKKIGLGRKGAAAKASKAEQAAVVPPKPTAAPAAASAAKPTRRKAAPKAGAPAT
jgi:predicted transcriptional regulator